MKRLYGNGSATVYINVLDAFHKSIRVCDFTKEFEHWKYELRQHSITCDVVNKLDGVPQGILYHPEFDALMHTWLVCRAVIELNRFDLLESAFLHDYGKGDKTTIGHDRIYSFGHAQESVKYIDTIKDHLDNYELCRRIVDKHMDFPVGHAKLENDSELSDFIRADKEISKSIFDREASSWLKFVNITKEFKVRLAQQVSSNRVYIMVGIPGSGKSSFLKNVSKKYIVSPDDIRREINGNVSDNSNGDEVWTIAYQRMKIILATYGKAYLDATNVVKWSRVMFMAGLDGRKIAVVFDVNVDVAIKRISVDIEKGVDRSNVPEGVVRKFHKMFERGKSSLQHEFNEVVYWRTKHD